MGKIYLIESNTNGFITYKIGKTTRNVKKRIKELSTGNSGELSVVFEFESENVNELERVLHRQFVHRRLNGEWFNDELDITKFIEACHIYEKAIQLIK